MHKHSPDRHAVIGRWPDPAYALLAGRLDSHEQDRPHTCSLNSVRQLATLLKRRGGARRTRHEESVAAGDQALDEELIHAGAFGCGNMQRIHDCKTGLSGFLKGCRHQGLRDFYELGCGKKCLGVAGGASTGRVILSTLWCGPQDQGHLVFKFNTNESQGLRWLGRQPAAGGGNGGMARPP